MSNFQSCHLFSFIIIPKMLIKAQGVTLLDRDVNRFAILYMKLIQNLLNASLLRQTKKPSRAILQDPNFKHKISCISLQQPSNILIQVNSKLLHKKRVHQGLVEHTCKSHTLVGVPFNLKTMIGNLAMFASITQDLVKIYLVAYSL